MFYNRYTGAAQDLVMGARGKLLERNWRTSEDKHATIDDISVFVIPLLSYQIEHSLWDSKYQALRAKLSCIDITDAQDTSTVNLNGDIDSMCLSVEKAVIATDSVNLSVPDDVEGETNVNSEDKESTDNQLVESKTNETGHSNPEDVLPPFNVETVSAALKQAEMS